MLDLGFTLLFKHVLVSFVRDAYVNICDQMMCWRLMNHSGLVSLASGTSGRSHPVTMSTWRVLYCAKAEAIEPGKELGGVEFRWMGNLRPTRKDIVAPFWNSFLMFFFSGWWCNSHLEKYESQWLLDYPQHTMENNPNVWNHQPDRIWYDWPSIVLNIDYYRYMITILFCIVLLKTHQKNHRSTASHWPLKRIQGYDSVWILSWTWVWDDLYYLCLTHKNDFF